MRSLVNLTVLIMLLAVPVPAQQHPAGIDTPAAAADAVLEAIRTGDGDALRSLAGSSRPDPWLVAGVLCARGEREAARQFAVAAVRPDTERLSAWVEARAGRPSSGEAVRLLEAAAELSGQGRLEDACELLARASDRADAFDSARILHERGRLLLALGRHEDSAAAFRSAAEKAGSLGWLQLAAEAWNSAGVAQYHRSDLPSALSCMRERIRVERLRDDEAGVASALGNVGLMLQQMGRNEEALRTLGEVTVLARKLGSARVLANALVSTGNAHTAAGRIVAAGESFEEALTLARGLNDPGLEGNVLGNLAFLDYLLGEYGRARRRNRETMDLARKVGDVRLLTNCGLTTGLIQQECGEFFRALTTCERTAEKARRIGFQAAEGKALGNLARVYELMDLLDDAWKIHHRVLELARKTGNRALEGNTLGHLGNIHARRQEFDLAAARFEEAVQVARETGHGLTECAYLGNLGILHWRTESYDLALEALERTLQRARECSDVRVEVNTLYWLALTHLRRGERDRALEVARSCLELADRGESRAGLLWAYECVATVHLERAEPEPAFRNSREAILLVLEAVGGLSVGEGASARDSYASVFEVGLGSAVAMKDAEGALFALEAGRAGMLLEGLRARGMLRAHVVAPELRDLDNRAREREETAAAALRRARTMGVRAEVRQAAEELRLAREAVREVTARIQRTSNAAVGLVRPRPDASADLRAILAEDEAMVLYGLTGSQAIALVLTGKTLRLVTLGPLEDLMASVDRLLLPEAPCFEPSEVASARKLLVEPLGLTERTRRILVSPQGRLGYVPFAALLPEREVLFVPSGTTYRWLRETAPTGGRQVLGLGDPAYPPEGRLTPLPASRHEIAAVADVALLGGQATEAGLRAALEEAGSLRAVHLACHGCIDPDHPLQSALALVPAEGDDGSLTCLEVFGLRLRADLVTLSACETATGRIYQVEGIVGLTRAFMHAGAPRVVCSLWKVDDAATRALMVKFYELWNPGEGEGLPAATALKQAQEHVRGHEKWSHPYYWAAWVLWGLP